MRILLRDSIKMMASNRTLKTLNFAVARKGYSLKLISTCINPLQSNTTPPEMVDLDDSKMVPIPIYKEKKNEPLALRKSRLLYQSRKRGMLENGLLLSTFAAKYLAEMTEKQVIMYDKLINIPSNDWDIYYWATGVKEIPDEYNNEMMDLFKKHVSNDQREQRFKQPDLYEKQ